MKHILVHLVEIVDVNIFFYKVGQIRQAWLRTNMKAVDN
jgi:hypothetical protein